MLTWAQLGIHTKPCGILNVGGYYDHLLTFLDQAVHHKFITAEHRATVLIDDDPEGLLRQFESYSPPTIDKAVWALGLKNS